MPASGWTLSPAVTHIFLTHTLEQKSPLFILRCMRSFCDTEHNPFFIILTGFKGMWLFQCDFPIVFVFVLLSSFVSLAFSMTSLWLSVQELLIRIFTDITPWRSFGRIIPVPWSFPFPCYQLLLLLLHLTLWVPLLLCLPHLETSSVLSEVKCRKKRGDLLYSPHLQHQLSNEMKPPGTIGKTRDEPNSSLLCSCNSRCKVLSTAAFYLGLTS